MDVATFEAAWSAKPRVALEHMARPFDDDRAGAVVRPARRRHGKELMTVLDLLAGCHRRPSRPSAKTWANRKEKTKWQDFRQTTKEVGQGSGPAGGAGSRS